MKARDFCYWLQGYFELREQNLAITAQQANTIKNHLSLVFKHDIDPSMGGPEHQAELNAAHGLPTSIPSIGGVYDGSGNGGTPRC